MSEKNHYVYILRCKDATYYTGYTTDVQRRLCAHENGKGAKYTRGRGPFTLVYEQKLDYKGDALKREREIKRMTRKEKEAIICKWRREKCDDKGTTELP
ncbi:GIY-YIG nuclease family protein [Salipaludibacillus sp. CUR1]|uniref:GIY-YIG nuclease family protein n=1 Tax=Salipaludibacillus sp. CUR1 TaxID=2820003 RepID=UPI001E469DC6|nr:GIY-YIG nuclease family protein [Salipaludibacillus sp. CUR1]MCE7791822.1 GIY-YIG nuclease family protein [Salipaludibacillus sp. CUR1]